MTSTFSQLFSSPPTDWLKWMFKAPVTLWRMGITPPVMLMLAHRGRKSGKVYYTLVEYHRDNTGRVYIVSGFGDRSQWYQNVLANPYITIETWRGVQHVKARRVTDADELRRMYAIFRRDNPTMTQGYLQAQGVEDEVNAVIASANRLHFLTFDPTDEPTPPPIQKDLIWLWAGIALAGWLLLRLAGSQKTKRS